MAKEAQRPLARPGSPLGRRAFLGASAASLAGAFASPAAGEPPAASASAHSPAPPPPVAHPPEGFVPMNAPGKVVRVSGTNTLQSNGLWPTDEAASRMLERAMTELTGAPDVATAFARFVHPQDKVAIKPNGLAGRVGATMASNKELVLAIVKGVIAAGVPAESIVVYEQWESFMAGTRVTDKDLVLDPAFPAGISAVVHKNEDATMDPIEVGDRKTRFVRAFTEATCVIDVGLVKDHSICGYTGCLKNITHGSIVNPHDFHDHLATPQIAKLYAQDVCQSRVRLHITDAYKFIYDEGPQDQNKKRRVAHESVYVTTDPVAMDVLGWDLVERTRKENGLPSLKDVGREPLYIRVAGDLGLGVFDRNIIRLREVQV